MATLLDYLDAPEAAPAAPTKSKQPSAQEMYGVKDLQDSLSQIQSTLPDYVPGSPSHKRALSDIQSIQSELQRHATAPQSAPKTGTLLDFLDAPASPDLSGPGSITPQGHLTPQQMEAAVKPAQPSSAAQALQRAFQLKQRAPGEVASVLDMVGNLPSQAVQAVGYGAGRLFGLNDKEALAAAAPVSQALANPAGRLMGVTDQPGYQASAPSMAQQAIGNVAQKGFEAVGERTGISPIDISQGVNAAMMFMPFAKAPIGRVASKIKSALPEYTVEYVGTTPSMGSVGAAAPVQKGLGSAGAAAFKEDPYAGQITGEESARGGQFPQIKLSKISQDVPKTEQAIRAQIANEILGDSGQIRPGVVTGNENTLRNEHTLAKMPDATPEGQVYKQQIANEQNALSNYAQERVKATGANPSLIDDEQRGRAVNDVFYGNHPDDPIPTSITGYFQKAKEQIYQSAKDRFGNNAIETSNVDNLLNNPQWTAGLEIKGNQGVASSAKKFLNLAKNVGFEDASGVMQPAGSVSAYDAVRKALNSEWSPQNSRAIAAVNNAIDKDIASAADPSLYKLGDNIHKLEKTIFESKGIADIFGPRDKNGVTLSSTPVEKVLPKLNNLPIEQWRHIHDTLNQFASGSLRDAPEGMPPIPPELQNAAAAAQKEITGALARKVYESGASKIGTWNQNSVNSTLNSTIGQKILQTFPQDEVAKFHTLNRGGYLMPGVHSYEGAALQQKRVGNLAGTLAEKGLTAGGAGLGGAFFGPPGAAAGAGIGQQVGGKVASALEQRALSKRATKAVEEMQKTAALNKTSLKDIGK